MTVEHIIGTAIMLCGAMAIFGGGACILMGFRLFMGYYT